MSVVIETTKGVFTVDLYTEARPKCELQIFSRHFCHLSNLSFINEDLPMLTISEDLPPVYSLQELFEAVQSEVLQL